MRRRVAVQVEKRGQHLTADSHITLDFGGLPWYAGSTMEVGPLQVGDLVRIDAEQDRQFDRAVGIIVRRVVSAAYKQGFHYEVQTLDGHLVVALGFEVEPLEKK